jgi:hypothetical protein
MPNITLSIREDNTPLWDYARRYADAHHTSLSGLATMALAKYLNQEAGREDGDIIVVARIDGQPTRVKFSGRWLTEPETTDMDHAGHPIRVGNLRAGVALTTKGRIAVYYQDTDGQAHLADFDSITEARTGTNAEIQLTNIDWDQADRALQPPIVLDI